MICKSCGRNGASDQSNYCDYCGSSLKDEVNSVQTPSNVQTDYSSGQFNAPTDGNEVSFKNWLGTLFIPWIPIVGPIIFLVLMIIWAVSKDVVPSKKNWARANLVVTVASAVLVTIIYILLFVLIFSSPMFAEEFMNSYY